MEQAPYRFGAPVEPPWFCDRERELQVVVDRMEAGIHVFVLSPRRYGKTSLIRRAAERVESAGGRTAYADLLLATNEVELATVILQAAVRGVLGPAGRARRSIEPVLHQLRVNPTVTVGPDGSVSLSLDPWLAPGRWLDVVADALAVLRRAAERRPAVLVLDEFQVVTSIGRATGRATGHTARAGRAHTAGARAGRAHTAGARAGGPGVGGAFKALADEASGVSIVFAGSHLAVMEQLTKGSGAPLHGMGERLALDVVPEAPMVAYLRRRARTAGKRLGTQTARHVYRLADAVPNGVQQLALATLEAAGAEEQVTDAHVDRGLQTVVERQASTFAQQFETLGSAPAQQRILKELARRPAASVYAKAFLDAVGVANANAVTTALHALDGREMVVRKGRVWDVSDPFFRHWLLQDR